MMLLLTIVLLIAGAEAGFRCSIGEFACTASCYTTLQDSGKIRGSKWQVGYLYSLGKITHDNGD